MAERNNHNQPVWWCEVADTTGTGTPRYDSQRYTISINSTSSSRSLYSLYEVSISPDDGLIAADMSLYLSYFCVRRSRAEDTE
jgi:hypothetical protein